MNRAARRRPLPLRLPLVVMSLTRSRHYNRKQSRASRLDQFALLKCATPLKYLMRVHALGLSNSSHARSRQKSEFYYPPLLSNAPPYPSTRQSHQHIVNGQLNLSPEGKGVRLQSMADSGGAAHSCRSKERGRAGVPGLKVVQPTINASPWKINYFLGFGCGWRVCNDCCWAWCFCANCCVCWVCRCSNC